MNLYISRAVAMKLLLIYEIREGGWGNKFWELAS